VSSHFRKGLEVNRIRLTHSLEKQMKYRGEPGGFSVGLG